MIHIDLKTIDEASINDLVRTTQHTAIRHIRIAKRVHGSIAIVATFPEPHLCLLPFNPTRHSHRDEMYTDARAYALASNAVAVLVTCEMWGATYPIPEGNRKEVLQAARRDLREGKIQAPSDREDRVEVVSISCHSTLCHPRKRMWHARILRSGGRPHLAPFTEYKAGLEGDHFRILWESGS